MNLVVPEALAVIKSPELSWLMIRAEFSPIPPETERGAGVFADDPIRMAVSRSLPRIRLPVPFGVMVRD